MKIPFTFSLSPDSPAITPGSVLWSKQLPASRLAFGSHPEKEDFDPAVTYGDYFTAARDFLTRNDCAELCAAVTAATGETTAPDDLNRVGIHLVKHGAFYHPSLVIADTGARRLHFVLNVAVSSNGARILDQEYLNFTRLHKELTTPFWPLVFARGRGACQGRGSFPMFLGQWLEGYYEFHLHTNGDTGAREVRVWDTDRGHWVLSEPQVDELIRQAASVLAYAYNPLTFEAILNWHHAAGDFVVSLMHGQLDVRLISVRKYAPMVRLDEPDVTDILDSMLVYLIHISLRLRIDRLHGTDGLACYPSSTVPAACRGFFHGLHSAAALRRLPEDFIPTLKQYMRLLSPPELTAMIRSVIKKCAPDTRERILLEDSSDEHAAALARTLAET